MGLNTEPCGIPIFIDVGVDIVDNNDCLGLYLAFP